MDLSADHNNDISSDHTVVPSNPQSGGELSFISEKRGLEDRENEEFAPKRPKIGLVEMRRVAEIVLVLSAMAGMRGGKSPTDAEVQLMEEARANLVEICQDLAPKDLVARDAIGTVIEELGLNFMLKDQRLGFRGSRLSIKEKFSLSKRKMEESKKLVAPSAIYTSQMMQASFGGKPESRGSSHTFRMLPSDKPSNISLPSGGISASFPAHVSGATSAPLTNQPLTTETRVSNVSTGLSSSQPGRDLSSVAFPKVEKTQFKVEGGSNGASYVPQVQANASANHSLVNAPSWSVQPHLASSGKSALENKVPNHNSAKAEGAADSGSTRATPLAGRDQTARSFLPQTPAANLPSIHPPIQGMKSVQPSTFPSNHNDIAKIVQKLLQPKLPENLTWTPPSREYMNKAMTCQICKLTVNEIETVVICDACESGFHLKCLEAVNQKGIPRGEWHCRNCLALSNGKPLPPKYGRVMRSVTPPKGPANPAGTLSLLEKKTENVDAKVNLQKATENESPSPQNPAGSGTDNNGDSASDPKIPSESETPINGIIPSGKDADQGTCSLRNNSTERSVHQDQGSESPINEKRSVSVSELQPSLSSDRISNNSEDSKPLHFVQTDESNSAKVPLITHHDLSIVEQLASVRGDSGSSSRLKVENSEQYVAHANPVESTEPIMRAGEIPGLDSGSIHSVEWIGNEIDVADGKTFYESCCVDGVSYKVQDHALFHSSHGKLTPSKLQAMWEEIETGLKWVLVSQCYFPDGLPKAVGYQVAPESNEVYESNHQCSMMASFIEGPCEVLPPTKFKEKTERHSQLLTKTNNGSPPVFICKWFYDKLKGNFQPVFS